LYINYLPILFQQIVVLKVIFGADSLYGLWLRVYMRY